MDTTYQTLVSLVARRFGKDEATIRPEDDFFQTLNIDSLKALELLSELEQTFSIEVPDYELQGVTTFAGLAEVIRRRL